MPGGAPAAPFCRLGPGLRRTLSVIGVCLTEDETAQEGAEAYLKDCLARAQTIPRRVPVTSPSPCHEPITAQDTQLPCNRNAKASQSILLDRKPGHGLGFWPQT